ncbi:hypothetical protein GTW29_13330 [Streptomyces sp. SID7834]|nr:hypothetical protein [Streptomyces sp. SID7834]MYT57683.1 hypothetical protein [Streptomyces sp. SID7834]
MSAELAAYLGAAAVVSAAAVTWAVRLSPAARPAEPEATPFFEPEPGVRYLRCDELRCAHMTYPHRPSGDGGTWVCSNCGNEKGGTQ